MNKMILGLLFLGINFSFATGANPEEAIKCYKEAYTYMTNQKIVNFDTAIQSKAISLCKGTSSAEKSLSCYKEAYVYMAGQKIVDIDYVIQDRAVSICASAFDKK